MTHRFYAKTEKKQNQLVLKVGLGALIVIILSFVLAWYLGVYIIGFLVFWIVLSIIAPFFDTPSLKKSGNIIYHSPLFLSEKPKNGVVVIHGGTLFDYIFVLENQMNGSERTKLILQQYLEGLLNFINYCESENVELLKIRGTSYIINENTATRIGFKIEKTDAVQKLILAFNYFNLLVSASVAKNKLTFPNLNETKTFEATLNTLSARKAYISNLNDKLKQGITEKI
ncbi:hypothetical protein [Formosa algae]|uniref:hypothetical protein n=1 Tax=Formosa algae TaxID=225843 RepID=UPI000CCDE4D2|nr:hypothetical protein [Formosa algae]PNW29075.1 hypothetical protein BKP44_05660 [Formosa algae]